MESIVSDRSLAKQGLLNIELAESRMGSLMRVKERFKKEKPFKSLNIGLALHVTKEAASLVRTLEAGGASVSIASCNPLSTQDDVAAALARGPTKVWAYKKESQLDYYNFIDNVVKTKPNITIDDGCDLVAHIHERRPEMLESIIGGCEETTTGVSRLRAMHQEGYLKYPVVAVNDNKTKHLLDNYYGTGQSTIDGILRASNILMAGKTVVVAGYGECGKGVALRASGDGSNVIVTEVDPFRALQAVLDGYRVMPMKEAAKLGDVFVTVTGGTDILTQEHFRELKDGALLANSGHFDVEIAVESLRKSYSSKDIRPGLEQFDVDGKKIYLAGEGRLVNLAAAEGHPSEVMATSFCGQALACEYLVNNRGKLAPGVLTLPENIDDEIARLQLDAMGIRIDSLSERQQRYLRDWREGT